MSYDYVKDDEPVPGYRVIEFLGAGGFGKVWKASAPGGTEVALKVIALGGVQGRKEFRALQLVKKIRHPNLIPVVAFWLKDKDGQILDDALTGKDELPIAETATLSRSISETMVVAEDTSAEPAELIIAMGLGGQSLFQRLEECQSEGSEGIPVDELLNYMEGAAEAIDYLNRPIHDLGAGQAAIQHCDIKPQNLMVVGGATQICDFGLSRMMGSVRSTMATAGTIAYAAPECLIDGEPSPTTDQYSLAITYFELRTGALPYASETFAGVTDAVIKGRLELSKLPDAEAAVVRRATSRDPQERYPSAVEMVQALRAAVWGDLGAAAGSARRIPVLAILAVITVMAVGGFFGLRKVILQRVEVAADGGSASSETAGAESDRPPVDEMPGVDGRDDGTPAATGIIGPQSNDPSDPDAQFRIGLGHLREGDFEHAVAVFETLAARSDAPQYASRKEYAEAYLERGTGFLMRGLQEEDNGQLDLAIADFRQGTRHDPDDFRLHSRLAAIYRRMENWSEVVDCLDKALAIEEAATDYVNRGQAQQELENLDAAMKDFSRAAELEPENGNARYLLGECHRHKKEYSDAVEAYTEAIGEHAETEDAVFDLVYAHFWRGVCGLALDRLDDAAADIEEALRQPESDQLSNIGPTLDLLADEFAKKGRYQEAIRWTKSALEAAVNPDQRAEYESQLKEYQAPPPDA